MKLSEVILAKGEYVDKTPEDSYNSKPFGKLKFKIDIKYHKKGGAETALSDNLLPGDDPWYNFELKVALNDEKFKKYYYILGAGLYKRMDDTWETHLDGIDQSFKGKGLGELLYKTIIDFGTSKGYIVGSSDTPSEDAKKLWNNLTKKYSIEKIGNRYIVK